MPTVKELHNKIRQHNASNCIKGYSNKKKATLVQIVSKLKTPTQHKQAGAGAGAVLVLVLVRRRRKLHPLLSVLLLLRRRRKLHPLLSVLLLVRRKENYTHSCQCWCW